VGKVPGFLQDSSHQRHLDQIETLQRKLAESIEEENYERYGRHVENVVTTLSERVPVLPSGSHLVFHGVGPQGHFNDSVKIPRGVLADGDFAEAVPAHLAALNESLKELRPYVEAERPGLLAGAVS
jgi:hypothetical protein